MTNIALDDWMNARPSVADQTIHNNISNILFDINYICTRRNGLPPWASIVSLAHKIEQGRIVHGIHRLRMDHIHQFCIDLNIYQ